ncbi:MAG: hypothetical protein CVT67_02530 [Actinobacteria bacterium HGW-Actinobacteria-7]|jgi:hypothetical protein|nr:MAG: hypothetical protein CVT67_02530 [Actinobacteria bacterium HGW-Actinobacteria-7]
MKKNLLIAAILAVVLVAGLAVSAVAANSTDTGSVTVTAKVNPKITLTLSDTAVDFGNVEPGTTIADKTVGLSVDSNKSFSLGSVVSGQDALMGFSADATLDGATGAKGSGTTFTDTYSLNVPWDTDPGDYTSTVQYTVTQD